MSRVGSGQQYNRIKRMKNEWGESAMATTGELRAIIELLELVDIGDAASYLGEEAIVESDYSSAPLEEDSSTCIAHPGTCGCVSCHILRS